MLQANVKYDSIIAGGENMEEMLTTKDLMRIYKVTRTTITDWRKAGMPYKKYGKIVRFDRNEVQRWLEER